MRLLLCRRALFCRRPGDECGGLLRNLMLGNLVLRHIKIEDPVLPRLPNRRDHLLSRPHAEPGYSGGQ
jgi:hypothetical protein